MSVLKHSAAQQRFRALGERFCQLQAEHRRASDAMWIGTLASSFNDEELAILADYICPNDVRLLRRVRQPATIPVDEKGAGVIDLKSVKKSHSKAG
jgi:hypothetical protein